MTEPTETATEAAPLTTSESAPEASAPAPEAPAPLSAGLRSIMERESALRSREEQIALVPQLQREVENLRNLARTNPALFLEQQGITMESFDKARQEFSDPTARMRRELEDLKQRVQLRDTEERDRNTQAQLASVRSNVVSWVDKTQEFPHVSAAGAGGLVFQKMQQHFQSTGQELSEKEAAKSIETELRALRDKLNAVNLDSQVTDSSSVAPNAPTLTNSSAAAQTKAPSGMISLEEAAQLLRFTD